MAPTLAAATRSARRAPVRPFVYGANLLVAVAALVWLHAGGEVARVGMFVVGALVFSFGVPIGLIFDEFFTRGRWDRQPAYQLMIDIVLSATTSILAFAMIYQALGSVARAWRAPARTRPISPWRSGSPRSPLRC